MSPTPRASTSSSSPRRERGTHAVPEPERTADEHDEADEHGDERRFALGGRGEPGDPDDSDDGVEPVDHERTDPHDAAAIDQQLERAEAEGMVTEHAKISATDPGPDPLHEPEPEPEPDHVPDPLDPEDEPDVDDR
jgi:hypothetical protein